MFNFESGELVVPQYGGMFAKFKKSYEKMHSIKKSKFVRLDKHKKKGKVTYDFRVKKKPDKKPKMGSVKPENVGRAQKYSKIS